MNFTIQDHPVSTTTKENATESLGTPPDGIQVGSFLFYLLIGAGSSIVVVVVIAIVILITCLIRRTEIKISNISLTASLLLRWRQRRNNNSNLEEIPPPEISTLPNCDEHHSLGDISPVEFESPVHSPPSTNVEEHEPSSSGANAEEHEVNRNRSLPPRKCDQIPIYIFLDPNKCESPFPKAPVECKNNLAYIHLGPKDSSTAVPPQVEPVTCKRNAAYIHLDPEDTCDSESM
jgi:hypothetical protein